MQNVPSTTSTKFRSSRGMNRLLSATLKFSRAPGSALIRTLYVLFRDDESLRKPQECNDVCRLLWRPPHRDDRSQETRTPHDIKDGDQESECADGLCGISRTARPPSQLKPSASVENGQHGKLGIRDSESIVSDVRLPALPRRLQRTRHFPRPDAPRFYDDRHNCTDYRRNCTD